MAVCFFLCLGYLTAGVEIFDFRFCGRANVVVIDPLGRARVGWGLGEACGERCVSPNRRGDREEAGRVYLSAFPLKYNLVVDPDHKDSLQVV